MGNNNSSENVKDSLNWNGIKTDNHYTNLETTGYGDELVDWDDA